MFIWRVWRQYIGHVYMKSLKRIHRTCLYEEYEENASDMFIGRVCSSYKHVLCILFKLVIWTCPMYSLYINMSYVFSSNSSYTHVLCILFKLFMKGLKRIHKTCLYEEFEENTQDMRIWRVWREYIGHVYMQRIHRTVKLFI
jgi:hypothetical protein